MHLSYNLLFVQVFGFLPLSVNATIVPSSLSAISDVAPSTKLNVSTFLNATTHCLLPVPPVVPVGLEICRPVLRRILLAPDADYIGLYIHRMGAILITGGPGCFVRLDRGGPGGEIAISKRTIVVYAWQVLLVCQNFDHGGWAHIDGTHDWIVIVSGDLENGEPSIGRGDLSLE